jgi:hypothetical protein
MKHSKLIAGSCIGNRLDLYSGGNWKKSVVSLDILTHYVVFLSARRINYRTIQQTMSASFLFVICLRFVNIDMLPSAVQTCLHKLCIGYITVGEKLTFLQGSTADDF